MGSKIFLNMNQGHGDILTFPHTILPGYKASFALDAVGTHGCRTCVCVYFPLSDLKCFIAHIDAHMKINLGGPPSPDTFVCNDAAAATALKEKVQTKLTETLRGHEAALQNVGNKSKAILICPWQKVEGQRSTGAYIVEAVCDFFSFEKAAMKTQDAHGFIIRPTSGEVRYLHWGEDGKARPSDSDFDANGFEEKFSEERPGKYGWTGFDHTNDREWTALWSRGEWVWADPRRAIGPGF